MIHALGIQEGVYILSIGSLRLDTNFPQSTASIQLYILQ